MKKIEINDKASSHHSVANDVTEPEIKPWKDLVDVEDKSSSSSPSRRTPYLDRLADIQNTINGGAKSNAKKSHTRFSIIRLKVSVTALIGVLVCQTVTTLIINPILQYRLDGKCGSNGDRYSDHLVLLLVVGIISLGYYVWLVCFLWSIRRRSFYIIFVIVCELLHIVFILFYVIATFIHKSENQADKFKIFEHITNTISLGVYFLIDLACLVLLIVLLVKKLRYNRDIKSQKVLFNADYHSDTMRIFV